MSGRQRTEGARPPPSIDLAFDPREPEPPEAWQPTLIAAPQPAESTSLGRDNTIGYDALDATLLAGYGRPPAHWAEGPAYTWRVFRRRRALREALTLRQEDVVRARDRVDDALVAFAERVRPIAASQTAYAAILDDLARAEDARNSREQGNARENEEASLQIATTTARVDALEAEFARARAEGREAATGLVTFQRALEREEANLERAEAELASHSNAKNERPASGVGVAAETEAGRSVWRVERDARLSETARLRAARTELEERYNSAKALGLNLAETLERAREVKASQKRFFQRRAQVLTPAVEESRKHVRRHLTLLGKRALNDRATFDSEARPIRAHLAALERALELSVREVGVHKLAMSAYDAPALRMGIVTIGLLTLVFIVAPIVWRATRVVMPTPIPHATDHH